MNCAVYISFAVRGVDSAFGSSMFWMDLRLVRLTDYIPVAALGDPVRPQALIESAKNCTFRHCSGSVKYLESCKSKLYSKGNIITLTDYQEPPDQCPSR